MMDNRLRNLFKKKFSEKLSISQSALGILGNSDGVVDVPNRPGYAYVQIRDTVAEVLNKRCAALPGVEVWVGINPLENEILQVLDYRVGTTVSQSSISPMTRLHGPEHTWGGNDPTPIWSLQIMDGRVTAYQDLSVVVYPLIVVLPGVGHTSVSEMTPHDLTSMLPTTTGYWVWVRVTVANDGAIVYTPGTAVPAASFTLGNIPAAPAGTLITLAAVRLYYGQTVLYEALDGSDILDLRFIHELPVPAELVTDTTNFNVILSAADNTVQKALDTLDDHTHAQLATLIINEAASSTGDFRAESQTEPDMLSLDASADALYLGGMTNGMRIDKGGKTTLLGTAALIVRTTATDPQDATPASRPAGVVGEIAHYGGKLYFCTNAATPTWEKITST